MNCHSGSPACSVCEGWDDGPALIYCSLPVVTTQAKTSILLSHTHHRRGVWGPRGGVQTFVQRVLEILLHLCMERLRHGPVCLLDRSGITECDVHVQCRYTANIILIICKCLTLLMQDLSHCFPLVLRQVFQANRRVPLWSVCFARADVFSLPLCSCAHRVHADCRTGCMVGGS